MSKRPGTVTSEVAGDSAVDWMLVTRQPPANRSFSGPSLKDAPLRSSAAGPQALIPEWRERSWRYRVPPWSPLQGVRRRVERSIPEAPVRAVGPLRANWAVTELEYPIILVSKANQPVHGRSRDLGLSGPSSPRTLGRANSR
jgi:hypothetical protein